VGKYSGQDMASASLREIAYYPNTPSQTINGVALMEASGSANVPVIEASDTSNEIRLVATYNMSPLSSGAREAYGRYTANQGQDNPPIYVIVGRFNVPFGLLTDEHRTYTRLQTNSTLNDFDDGVAVSGLLFQTLSYDLAITNDLQAGGSFTSNDVHYGVVGNLRWMPSGQPFFLGASQNYEYSQVVPEPYATSLYGALSVERLFNPIKATLLFEGVTARNWNTATVNPEFPSFFIPTTDSTYQTAVANSQSLGFYGMIKYEIGPHWSVFYKFDSLEINADFPGDVYNRHGLGFETFISSNLILNARVEKALVTRTEIQTSGVLAAQDDFLAMLRLWL
jgi:hypothetical protein